MSNLWEKLERLRQKKDHEKQRIALISSIIITLLIAAVWLSTYTLDTNSVTANTTSPFQDFKEKMNFLFEHKPTTNLPQ